MSEHTKIYIGSYEIQQILYGNKKFEIYFQVPELWDLMRLAA